MDHSFEVGKEYSNRNGRYEVIALADPKMRIRYEDGREDVVTISIQARIWDAIQLELQQPKPAVSAQKGRKRKRTAPARQGSDFTGEPFADDVCTVFRAILPLYLACTAAS